MIFYRMSNRQDFAGYLPATTDGVVDDARVPEFCRERQTALKEYLGEPPRKPGKHGDLHVTGSWYFVRPRVLTLLEKAARGHVASHPTTVAGREAEDFQQVWVLNFVDCLDIGQSSISEPLRPIPGKVGTIKRPVFDESRWDGSDLFVVPQDRNCHWFCTEKFVADWKAAKLKGAEFSRFLMDPESIKC